MISLRLGVRLVSGWMIRYVFTPVLLLLLVFKFCTLFWGLLCFSHDTNKFPLLFLQTSFRAESVFVILAQSLALFCSLWICQFFSWKVTWRSAHRACSGRAQLRFVLTRVSRVTRRRLIRGPRRRPARH